jgi:hypothetical protein
LISLMFICYERKYMELMLSSSFLCFKFYNFITNYITTLLCQMILLSLVKALMKEVTWIGLHATKLWKTLTNNRHGSKPSSFYDALQD